MIDYHLSFKLSEEERTEHVHRLQRFATCIADKLATGESVTDWERDFAAVALRQWADAYNPKRQPGQGPRFSHVDAALHYALLRDRRLPHPKAINELLEHRDDEGNEIYPVTAVALWKTIRPIYKDACAHLEIKPKPIPK